MSVRTFLRNIKSNLSSFLNLDILYGEKYFSQWGEDKIIEKLTGDRNNGFYVDIGSHHPFRYSNTQLLYKNGWRGINIDPDLSFTNYFKISRKSDINLNIAIGNNKKNRKYFVFEDNALNTFIKNRADEIVKSNQSKLVKVLSLSTHPLSEILNRYLPEKTSIDLLNIDVEGMEMEVLQSNQWNKYKPTIILVENTNKDTVYAYLRKLDYKLIKSIGLTQFFLLNEK